MGRREGGRKGGTKRGGASCREVPEDQAMSCCVTYQVPGGGRGWSGDEGSRVDKKGPDGGRDRTAGFSIFVKKDLLFKYRNDVFYTNFSRKTPIGAVFFVVAVDETSGSGHLISGVT